MTYKGYNIKSIDYDHYEVYNPQGKHVGTSDFIKGAMSIVDQDLHKAPEMEINYVAINNFTGEIIGAPELRTVYQAARHHVRSGLHDHSHPGDWHFFRGNFQAIYSPDLEIKPLHMGASFFEEGKYYACRNKEGKVIRLQVIKRDERTITIANPLGTEYIDVLSVFLDDNGNERAKVWLDRNHSECICAG